MSCTLQWPRWANVAPTDSCLQKFRRHQWKSPNASTSWILGKQPRHGTPHDLDATTKIMDFGMYVQKTIRSTCAQWSKHVPSVHRLVGWEATHEAARGHMYISASSPNDWPGPITKTFPPRSSGTASSCWSRNLSNKKKSVNLMFHFQNIARFDYH